MLLASFAGKTDPALVASSTLLRSPFRTLLLYSREGADICVAVVRLFRETLKK